ncbi:hypothetical protein GUJ93_ZPchr0012g18839 [Zizania palustris]|uniref:C3H1-type domain-containing protein n=1 Tax=Zizania palustris TaxID=103762 RepID=A0A8J5WR46_ZIZPA|nr:hypothetical protein GUJ93_ZPchr0012g18839 [Zizania palustris]
MADADAMAPPKSATEASPMGSTAGEAVEQQLAGLAVADQEELIPRPPAGRMALTSAVELRSPGAAAGRGRGGGDGAAAADSRPRFPSGRGARLLLALVVFSTDCAVAFKCTSFSGVVLEVDPRRYGDYVPDISAEVNSLVRLLYLAPQIIDVEEGKTEPNELKVAKEKRTEFIFDGSTQEECKYYSTPWRMQIGKSCKYLHRDGKEGKPEAEKADLNFLGLPLRPGEKECPYYMRTGSCKYATNCKFHHPDPSNVASKDRLEHENGAPSPSYSAGMLPPQGMYPSPEWNGYHQVPLNPYYPPGVGPFQHFPAPIAHPMYKPAEIPAQQQLPSDQYPERPGQPECQHFVKSGFANLG